MTVTKRLLLALLGFVVVLTGLALASGGPASAYPVKSPATISVSPAHPVCGQPITVSGQHFKPGEVVHIKVNGHTEATTVADKNGDFSSTFPLNCYGADSLVITANGVGGDVDSLTVSVAHSDPGDTGGTTHSGSGSGSGGLSYTGVAVVGVSVIGVLFVLVGGLLMLTGRRRRTG